MLTDARHTLRLFAIGWTLARYDALFPLEALGVSPALLGLCRLARRRVKQRPGVRLALALQALGPTAIKLGQALSTRADLIGEDVAADLSVLQDRLPPFATSIARATVEEQLGAPIASLFSSFEDESVAAASIAQVHFATTTDGREVAVKILRPHIEAEFARDTELLRWLAEIAFRRLPHYRRLKPLEMVETFARTISIELDLRLEAAAAEELKANTRDDPDFYVPAVDWGAHRAPRAYHRARARLLHFRFRRHRESRPRP
ncbi:MAG: AarF/UbiB family protein [Alphaproteobacteria bacterium]